MAAPDKIYITEYNANVETGYFSRNKDDVFTQEYIRKDALVPDNLDEAAHDYAWEKQDMVYDAEGERLMDYGPRYDAFKAGAEWMAKQGLISEGLIIQTSGEDTTIELNEHIGYLEDCDEVIVQIRKKQ